MGSLGGDTYARAINAQGDVVGHANLLGSGTRAFLWTEASGIQDLGSLGGSSSYAQDINDSGVVVGSGLNRNGRGRAFIWSAERGMRELGLLSGSDLNYAQAINNKGFVVGQSGLGSTGKAFIWSESTGMRDLGSLGGASDATDINDEGVVVGSSVVAGQKYAFIWDETRGMRDLGMLAGNDTVATAISRDGTVVGYSSRNASFRSFIWTEASGMRELIVSGSSRTEVYGFSDGGAVAGTYYPNGTGPMAFFWTEDEGVQSLPSTVGSYSYGYDINADGWVTGYGPSVSRQLRATRWQRIKEDQTLSFTSDMPATARVGGVYTPVATSSSELPVTFSSLTDTVCTLVDLSVSFVAPGECTVRASQAGNARYEAAPDVLQTFQVTEAPAPPAPEPYLATFETVRVNTLIYSIKVGQGLVYQGKGAASKATLPVVGKRRSGTRILEGHRAKVITIYGSRRLVISSETNTPYAQGGRLKLSFAPNFSSAGVTVQTLKVSNITSDGAKATVYSVDGKVSTFPLARTGAGITKTFNLNAHGVKDLDIYVANAFAVDDVAFVKSN